MRCYFLFLFYILLPLIMIKRRAKFQINITDVQLKTVPRILNCICPSHRTYTLSLLPPIFPESKIFRSKRHAFLAFNMGVKKPKRKEERKQELSEFLMSELETNGFKTGRCNAPQITTASHRKLEQSTLKPQSCL